MGQDQFTETEKCSSDPIYFFHLFLLLGKPSFDVQIIKAAEPQ
jgi:hypothetical protein